MAPPSTLVDPIKLLKRIASALVLLAVAAGAIWFGDWPMVLFFAVLATLLYWEWCQLTAISTVPISWAVSIVIGVFCVLSAYLWPEFRLPLIAALTLGSIFIATRRFGRFGFWLAFGPPLIAATMIAAIYLRLMPDHGLETVFWAVFIVSSMDIGGYAFGKAIGGPRMAPNISPGKTWAGLLGGTALAAAISVFVGLALGGNSVVTLVLLGAGLALAAQAGDLLESAWKRHFDAKDSSALLPGHGGFLDRFDGYLTVFPIVALMAALSGRSPLLWP